ALCSHCARTYDPPTCRYCAKAINRFVGAQIRRESFRLAFRMLINALFFFPYFAVLAAAAGPREPVSAASSSSPSTADAGLIFLFRAPTFICGFLAFRWLLNAYLQRTGTILFADFRWWATVYVIGSLVCGALSLVIIPVLLVMQTMQLVRMAGLI